MRISDWSSDVCSSDLLTPAWNDTTTDTPADAPTITSLWGTAAQAVAALQAAIQGLAGPAGTPGTDGVDGIDGTDGKLVEFVWKRAATVDRKSTRLNSSH